MATRSIGPAPMQTTIDGHNVRVINIDGSTGPGLQGRRRDCAQSPDPQTDLWLSTNDGRYSSPLIHIRVGQLPQVETFLVHRKVLIKFRWFDKAICGHFKESEEQAIYLPEEQPGVFHFVIAFMYEGRYDPIQPAASVLNEDKGKGKEVTPSPTRNASITSSDSSLPSDSNVSDRHRVRRRRARATNVRDDSDDDHLVHWKRRNIHRPGCMCSRCANSQIPHQRGFVRTQPSLRPPLPPPPPPPPPPPGYPISPRPPHPMAPRSQMMPTPVRQQNLGSMVEVIPRETVNSPTHRIPAEELTAWLMAYELNLEVYICAVRLLMDDLQKTVMRSTIDMLETAGSEAAQTKVLQLCAKLRAGVDDTDALLTMILARVGFLQALLWERAPVETGDFLVANPELAAMMLREMSRRHDQRSSFRDLPAMELNIPLKSFQ